MLKATIAVLIFSVSAGALAYNLPIENFFGSQIGRSGVPADDYTIDQAVSRLALRMNENLPMEVDKETRLDKVSAEAGKQLTYHYTLFALRSTDVNKEKFHKTMYPQLKKKLCESGEMKSFLKSGVSIVYAYRGKDVQPIGDFKYTPADCGYKK